MDRVVLFIDPSASYCGACGWGAFPHEETHETLAGYGIPYDRKGCGARWNTVSSHYFGMSEDFYRRIQDMRPDLEYVYLAMEDSKILYEDLPLNQ